MIIKTKQAEIDLDEIWLQIAVDNIVAADGLLDAVDHNCKLLAGQPMMGRARPELLQNLRSFPVGRYVLFYMPSGNGIELVRVLHSARDSATLFSTP